MFVRYRSFLKNLIHVGCLLFFCFFSFVLPFPAQADNSSNMNTTPDQIMLKMKDRLRLTEDQEARVRPVIEEMVNKRRVIIENSMLDGKTKRSALQQLQWSMDMKLGQIFTEEQMTAYQRLRQEQNEQTPHGDIRQGGDMQRSRGSRSGGQIGF